MAYTYPSLERAALLVSADITLKVSVTVLHGLELLLVSIDKLKKGDELEDAYIDGGRGRLHLEGSSGPCQTE